MTEQNIHKNQPIGLFDSGLGGLSICHEVVSLLPKESIIYLADSKNAPYGQKSRERILELCIKNTELLLEMGCKIVVVACNTATTNAIETLRASYQVPFIGIEPAIKPAALHSVTNKIGILATKGTLNSELFARTSEQFRSEMEIIEVEGEGLVPLIEQGRIEDTRPLLQEYLDTMIKAGVDKIVLGCSHYPFLEPVIRSMIPANIDIIDSGEAVANQTKAILQKHNLLRDNQIGQNRQFFTNAEVNILKSFLDMIRMPADRIEYLNF